MQVAVRSSSLAFLGCLALGLVTACGDGSGVGSPVAEFTAGQAPGPTAGAPTGAAKLLNQRYAPSVLASATRGEEVFNRKFKPSEGLGPFYNVTSCEDCHSTPVVGGAAPLYRNFYLVTYGPPESQTNHPYLPSPIVPAYGGSHDFLQATFSTTNGRIHVPATLQGFPANIEQRSSISALGSGAFELISDATILSNTDPDDLDGDGISGRYNTERGAIGRFGLKAQANNLEGFARGPLMNQMGITTNPFEGAGAIVSLAGSARRQVAADPNAPTMDNDGVPDPELSHQELGDLINFTRLLPPPQQTLPFSAAATAGEATFAAIGCVKCHIPSLPSSGGPVEAYTDLLIHDMGADLTGSITQGAPQPSSILPNNTLREWRTAPLWGVKDTNPYLHDGRAETIDEAIRLHDGEALAIRQAYEALTQTERDELLEFLDHL